MRWLFVASVACGGGGPGKDAGDTGAATGGSGTASTATGSGTGTGTGTGSTTPTDVTFETGCPDAASQFAQLDYVGAHDAWSACVAADPTDAEARFGKALTRLMLASEWAPVVDGLAACGETRDYTGIAYGSDGWLGDLRDDHQGAASLTVTYVDGAGETAIAPLSNPAIVYTSTYRDGIDFNISDTVGRLNEVDIDLFLDDAFGDGSGVLLSPGLVIDLARGADPRDGESELLRVWTACDQPGSGCDGWEANEAPASGTITVDAFGVNRGDRVEVRIDAEIPARCDSAPCSGRFRVVGTVSDTVSDDPPDDWVPFIEFEDRQVCNHEDCDWRTEAYTALADWCDVPDHAWLSALAGELADELDGIATDFEAAAAPDLAFRADASQLFFVGRTVFAHQTDAMAVAATLHAAAAAARLAGSYDILDPAQDPDAWIGPYVDDQWSDRACEETGLYGVPMEDFSAAMDTHLGNHSATAGFEEVRTSLRTSLTLARDAVSAEPTGDGHLDLDQVPSWSDAVVRDLDALITSLDGGATPIPSAAGWQATLGTFLDDPPSRASVISETGVASLFRIVEDCETDLELRDPVATWLEDGAHGFVWPRSVVDGDGPYPVLLDDDEWERIQDDDDVPRLFTPEARAEYDAW